MSTCAILFIKNPVSGTVKTRLQPELTPDEAATLYAAFVLDCVETLRAVNADRKIIAYTPASQKDEIELFLGELAPLCELKPQPQTDMGGRLSQMMQQSFLDGAKRTVIIGSDSPSLPAAIIDGGLQMLREADIVLGPCTDGGYYLVGQSTPDTSLFERIDWSTGQVLQQTLKAAENAKLGLLTPWYDVDTAEDAAFLRVHLRALKQSGEKRGTRSLAVLEALELPAPS